MRRILLIMVGFAGTASAAEGAWTPLFDGATLQGWKQVNGTAPYAVVDGAIVGTTRTGTPNSFLATERTYGDFVLELEFRQEGVPANSGVQFRSSSRPEFEQGRVFGYQADIDPAPRRWNGGIYEEAGRGWLYPVSLNPDALSLYRPNEWNHMRIEAIGSRIRTWVNGSPVAHLIDDNLREGFIALQVHSVETEQEAGVRTFWRNIRICETCQPAPVADSIFIRNTRPNDLDGTERAQGWRLLWGGRSGNGWRSAAGAGFPARGWRIADGALIVERGGQGGDLVSTDAFTEFELQLEFQLTPGANSGVMYLLVPGARAGEYAGLEYQLLDDERHPDARMGVDGNRRLAALYDILPRAQLMSNIGIAPQVGRWQHARIVVRGDRRVEHWLNGVKVLEFALDSAEFRGAVARSKFREIAGFGEPRRSPILLQDHGDEVRFRSIKVREPGSPLPRSQ